MYGYVKTDAIYDNHAVGSSEFLRYTTSASPSDEDFRLSVRSTRLGFDVDAGDGLTGKVEGDLLGHVNTTSTSPRLRHAFIQAKRDRWTFLAGQTWHLTPLEMPDITNDYFMGNAGALWMRVPQLRVSRTFADSGKASFAVTRPTTRQEDDAGTAAGRPGVEASVESKVGAATLTLSGALGRIKNTAGNNETGSVELVDLGFKVPLGGGVTLNGQLWTGRNLADFLGGIGQVGYGTSTVRASGGFADLRVQASPELWFNAIYGMDDPHDAPLPDGSPVRNQTWLANVNRMFLDKRVTATFEVAYNLTDYKLVRGVGGRDKRSAMHYQLAFKFPF
jgi:hypothetical protein